MTDQPNNPLHGVKLAEIVEHLVEKYGWEELSEKININCFKMNPSVKSSLKFLRKTLWAREKVERLYLWSIDKHIPHGQSPRQSTTPPAATAPIPAPREVEPEPEPKSKPEPEPEPETEDAEASESPWEAAKKARESNGR